MRSEKWVVGKELNFSTAKSYAKKDIFKQIKNEYCKAKFSLKTGMYEWYVAEAVRTLVSYSVSMPVVEDL